MPKYTSIALVEKTIYVVRERLLLKKEE